MKLTICHRLHYIFVIFGAWVSHLAMLEPCRSVLLDMANQQRQLFCSALRRAPNLNADIGTATKELLGTCGRKNTVFLRHIFDWAI